jgi:hypothetical protein
MGQVLVTRSAALIFSLAGAFQNSITDRRGRHRRQERVAGKVANDDRDDA